MDIDYYLNKKLDKMCEGVWLGSQSDASDLKLLKDNQITHVLVCGKEQKFYFEKQFTYLKLDLYNFAWDADLTDLFDQAVDFMKQGNCLVHCAAGMHRAPTFVLAFLIREQKMTFDQAYSLAKKLRPRIDTPENFVEQLKQYEQKLRLNRK